MGMGIQRCFAPYFVMNFFIRKLDARRFDVFEGKQWSTWSRLKSSRKGVFVEKGLSLPYNIIKALADNTNPNLQEQTIILN